MPMPAEEYQDRFAQESEEQDRWLAELSDLYNTLDDISTELYGLMNVRGRKNLAKAYSSIGKALGYIQEEL